MRGDIMFRVYGVHEGREKDAYFGVFRTSQEARTEVEKLKVREMNGRNWAKQYHDKGFAIREVVVATDFEMPSRPKPRDKYYVKATPTPSRPGVWQSTVVEVFRRNATSASLERICEYERNYSMLQTFEPFRQGGRDFALISRDYTKTAVLDLASGVVIAEEAESGAPGTGFCPVGFYVPDWWDVNDGSALQGSEHWTTDKEWPTGTFGFVWGCYWGDDSSWKVQCLDLSRIQEGIINREERFGYLELATAGFNNPCFALEPPAPQGSASPHFISISKYEGIERVTFAVEMAFDLSSGKSAEWQRLKVGDFD
jgi:hypothetical protein